MNRTLIIPAAGRGSRLQSDLPKVLYPVAGRAMLDHLLDLYSDFVDRFVLVLSPEFQDQIHSRCSAMHRFAGRFDYAIQERPDGMLPAILAAAPVIAAHQPDSIWITWCDQIAVRPGTVRRLLELSSGTAGLVLPTVRKTDPYIHFERDAANRISAVLHPREGDVMPAIGESDSGLFALVRVRPCKPEFGSPAAVYIMIQDADLEYDPQDYIPMLRALIADNLDAVYGSRYLKYPRRGRFINFISSKHTGQSLPAYAGGQSLSLIALATTGHYISDTVTALKLFRAGVIRPLNLVTRGFELDHELTAKILARGARLREVPIRYYPRTKAEGKKIGARDWLIALKTFMRFRNDTTSITPSA